MSNAWSDRVAEHADVNYVLHLGDTALINSQRLSEWCGTAPTLEEDIAIANLALDYLGRARLLLSYAALLQGQGRNEDDLAYFRDTRDWRNLLIVELPRDDFANFIARQYFVSSFDFLLLTELAESKDQTLNGIAAKALKETTYHVRYCTEWMLRLGGGTKESNARLQKAVNDLWPYCAEMFHDTDTDRFMTDLGFQVSHSELRATWLQVVSAIIAQSELTFPEDGWGHSGGRDGLHTEYFGYLLAEMQFLQRAFPGLKW